MTTLDCGIHTDRAKVKRPRKPVRIQKAIEIDGRLIGWNFYQWRNGALVWVGRQLL